MGFTANDTNLLNPQITGEPRSSWEPTADTTTERTLTLYVKDENDRL